MCQTEFRKIAEWLFPSSRIALVCKRLSMSPCALLLSGIKPFPLPRWMKKCIASLPQVHALTGILYILFHAQKEGWIKEIKEKTGFLYRIKNKNIRRDLFLHVALQIAEEKIKKLTGWGCDEDNPYIKSIFLASIFKGIEQFSEIEAIKFPSGPYALFHAEKEMNGCLYRIHVNPLYKLYYAVWSGNIRIKEPWIKPLLVYREGVIEIRVVYLEDFKCLVLPPVMLPPGEERLRVDITAFLKYLGFDRFKMEEEYVRVGRDHAQRH
ncbi:hypothetical protein DRQ20_04775 [bacterium]|nr:MAG: hypothetical protein DRQ20_04775 [bacterium]